MLQELPVLSSRFDFSNSNYNYSNTNTNVSSHLCNILCSINLARMAKNSEHKKSFGNHPLVVKMIFKMQRQTNTNNMDVIQHSGSVDDIRCSLSHINPVTGFEIRDDLDFLNRSLAYEVKNQNRVTVIKMLQAKINKVKKLKPGAQKNG